ncbi:MAG: BatA domain-containing protein, partial [Alphaproteobacteria bacterium]|nr:BatA domain-containing protein [Alphaproteobacteria bacterium]
MVPARHKRKDGADDAMTGLSTLFAAWGGLQFLSPLALWAFLALPLLWWLLRLTPPAPKRLIFPALILLRDLPPLAQSPAHTPWWLLVLRLLILSLLFLGLARPVLTPNSQLPGRGPLVLIIDNGWAAGDVWPQWQASFMSLCRQAEREQRTVLIVPTAPTEQSGTLNPIGPAPALTTCPSLTKVQPHPWPTDHGAALKLLTEQQRRQTIFWYSDGLRGQDTETLYRALQSGGDLTLYREEKPRYLLQAAPLSGSTLRLNVTRADPSETASVLVTALDKRNQTIGLAQGNFKPRDKTLTISFDLPGAVRNQAAQLVLQDNHHAGGVWLLDGSSARHNVGLIGDEISRQDQPLLNGLHYLERALNERNDVSTGTVASLIEKHAAVICNTNEKPLLTTEQSTLASWVEQGGVLVQFAGAALEQTSPLLPAPLRQNRRDLGGIFSWAKPQGMQPFPANTPFSGLALPADVSVSQQLLAD